MKRVLALFSVVAAIVFVLVPAGAQTPNLQPDYQLRILTIDDMIAEVLPVIRAVKSDQAYDVVQALEAEFLARYADTATYMQLTRAVYQLAEPVVITSFSGCCIAGIDENPWMARIAQRWLIENQTQLEAGQVFGEYPFRITPEPFDFDGDGQSEWILDIEWREETERYRNYSTAVEVGDSYQVHPVPVPYLETRPGQERINQGLRDINSDAAIDWVFVIARPAPGWGMSTNESYNVVTWRGDRMERLYAGYGKPMNIDDDPAMEFVDTWDQTDNWMCGQVTRQIDDWNGSAYVRVADQVIPNNDCTARRAEEAMWTGDFETAANLYTVYINTWQSAFEEYAACVGTCYNSLSIELYRYFIGRRIIAYALMGDVNRVEALLNEASADTEIARRIRYGFVQALLDANSPDIEPLCQAAYVYFAESFRGASDNYGQPIAFLPGEIRGGVNDSTDPLRGYRVNPVKAGCDIALFSGAPTPTPTLTPTPWPTYPPPTPDTRSQTERWVENRYYAGLFNAGDYAAILTLTADAQVEDETQHEAIYWRALTLEVSGQTQAALDTYIALFLNAPGSWWGWLAGMHLSRG
ncbi:MAG: hypothetical protein J0M33_15465 [Anaerolineae bacterium]|nr:hypothetical protein [Anaerolineae bacterium]